ncbi:hypothetical protein FGG08_006405 [Glutinoglossum americanum]|uniref:Fe2OG dioxygenase domain-containing protein n=1 Tax=Glutinoglossum americanum TaxID=1670608 RepID=A0A9P8HSN8_9PEZI|nr:hypothetical protein FGG08_006405 [Glutinoglossum americanum]
MPPKGNKGKQRETTKAKSKSAKTSSESGNSNDTLPDWPRLQPLVPSTDLSIQTLLPNQIILIPNLLTPTLCRAYVSFLSALPLSTTPSKPKKGDEALRINDRYQVDDPAFAKRLWEETALKGLVLGSGGGEEDETMTDEERRLLWGGEVVGLNPNIRVYRYRKGQFFAQHYDDSNVLIHPSNTRAKTTWTLLLYLTTPSAGGETIFYPSTPASPDPSPISIPPSAGMALLHRHGKECLLHEGREVVQGEKWVLRTDLCVKS